MGQPQPKQLQIASRLCEVAAVHNAVVREVEACGHGPDAQFAVRLGLDEAIANAIHLGNCDDPAKSVTVRYWVTENQVQVSICDEGEGFNPALVPDPTLPENLIKPNGRDAIEDLLRRSFQ